uniref:nucleolar protein 8 n=1 Tax=Epinephelus lanceolatus TaxID=310571 RepID=UPI0014451485|nr:nucleolar protein 8 [Epinephelus lanceolatus]
MRRLYIGGLSHTVTQKDLKDRFGKFGDVEDVEVRTRRDDEGVPYKTFGYININISDADLKKCLTVLNKSKWKGGTLQIETAKESFLHRLAEERQAAAEQRLQQPAAEDKRQKMLDSLSKAGVENFTMKAAVPGTEIPGHKDWVVSKFGRVLPILQLRCQKGSKARTQKYDPSKYSHNIRKLDRSTVDESTPVTQLTWEVQGGDDDISKKRRGEFPPYEPPKRKKSRTDSSQNSVGRNRFKQTDDSVGHNETHQFTNGYEPPTNHRLAQKRPLRFTDSDIDSDEEIRRMVASQNSSHVALQQEEEEDILEVVGLDYLEKSGRVRQQQKGGPDDEEENGYNSADTDELFASRKPPPPQQERLTVPTEAHLSGNDTDGKKKTKKKSKAGEEEDSSTEEHLLSRKPSSTQQRAESSQKQSKKMTVPTVVKPPVSQSDSDEDDDDEDEDEEELESADYSSDSDYETMFSNATRLEISFADLKRLAEESLQTPETTSPSIPGTSSEQETNLTSGPAERPAPKKGTMPDEILAAIMEEDSSEDEQKKKKKKRKAVVSAPLPAFQGTRTLGEGSETHECQRRQNEEEEGRGAEVKKQKLEHPETEKKTSESSEEEEEEEEEREEQEKKGVVKSMTRKAETVSSSSSDDDEDEDDDDVEDEDGEESESADYSSDSDYEAMFSNITRLEISFADLQRLAEESQQTSETTAPSIPGTSCKQETDLTSGPAEPPAQKQKLDSEAPQLNHRAADSKTSGQKHTDTEKKTSESSEEEEEEVEEEEEEEEEQEKKGVGKNITGKNETTSSSDDDEDEEEEEEEDKMKANQTVLTVKASATASSSSSGSSASSSEEEEEEGKQAPPRVPLGAKEEKERQREANLRRLAAVQQRQKEAEEHKKLIQGALANLDAPTARAGKHIVFGSDDDDDGDGEDKKQITSEVTVPKKTLFQDSQSEDEATGDEAAVSKSDTTKEKVRLKPSGPQLFSGSDDEEDADEEEDGSRFDIRPQFEGRSGQKLMELQSRFGTDERFRMDSRFLEEDEDKEEDSEKKKSVTEEEEALEEEKKKNLSILQSVLGSSQQTCSSKTPTKAKTFRDVSALHYDPSREEHAAFETKTDETKKESKAARRKKREEAQKLPEVSKEIFYDVSGDLKAVFGQTKEDDVAGEDEKKNWDQEEEEEEEGGKDEQPTPLSSLLSADPSVEKVESSGFKFSFFGDDTETGSGETAEYKIESIQAPKVSWQQNLHFQDSSSDEEEEEKEEEEEQSNVVATTTEEETSSKRDLFFFYPEDVRLKEGPRLFCRPSQLEEQREQWEERRSELKQEYRKKHKDARRKLKSSLKS